MLFRSRQKTGRRIPPEVVARRPPKAGWQGRTGHTLARDRRTQSIPTKRGDRDDDPNPQPAARLRQSSEVFLKCIPSYEARTRRISPRFGSGHRFAALGAVGTPRSFTAIRRFLCAGFPFGFSPAGSFPCVIRLGVSAFGMILTWFWARRFHPGGWNGRAFAAGRRLWGMDQVGGIGSGLGRGLVTVALSSVSGEVALVSRRFDLVKGVFCCALQAWRRPTLPRLKTEYHRR